MHAKMTVREFQHEFEIGRFEFAPEDQYEVRFEGDKK
jgi:hypothetical protein